MFLGLDGGILKKLSSSLIPQENIGYKAFKDIASPAGA